MNDLIWTLSKLGLGSLSHAELRYLGVFYRSVDQCISVKGIFRVEIFDQSFWHDL